MTQTISKDKQIEQLEAQLAELTAQQTKITKQYHLEVAKREQLEKSLAESQALFLATWEFTADGLILSDSTGQILLANPAFYDLFDLSSEQVVGQNLTKIFNQDTAQKIPKQLLTAHKRQKSYVFFEVPIHRPDGLKRIVQIKTTFIENEQGDISLLSTFKDVTNPRWPEEALQKYPLYLEELVARRTDELTQTNNELQQEILERKNAEDALWKTAQRFRSLIENASDIIVVLDREFVIRYISPSAVKILGYYSKDTVGKRASDFIHPDDQAVVAKNLASRLAGVEASTPSEFRVKASDGSWRVLEGTTKNLLNDPTVGGLVTNLRNITERKAAEEVLRESEIFNRTILNSLSAQIAVLDRNATIIHTNEAWKKFGRDNQNSEIIGAEIGTNYLEIYQTLSKKNKATAHLSLSGLQAVLQRDSQQFDLEYRYPYNSTEHWFLMRGVPLQTKQGGLVVSHVDITRLKKMEIENANLYQASRQQAEKLRSLNRISQAVNSSLDLQETLTIITDETIKLLDIESAAVALYDTTTNELQFAISSGVNAEFLRGKRITLGAGVIGWVVQEGEPAIVPDTAEDSRFYKIFDQQSGFQTRSILCAPLQHNGSIIGALEVVNKKQGTFTQTDLELLMSLAEPVATAIVNAQLYEQGQLQFRRLQESQALLVQVEKMAALGRLVASIAHEINNPLQSVQNGLALIEEELAEDNQAEVNEYLTVISQEIMRVAKIVQRMRDFYRPVRPTQQTDDSSRLDSDSIDSFYRPKPEETQVINLHDILDNVLQLAHKQLQHNRIKIENIWHNTLPTIHGNPDHLKQVFLNLVLNANDAMTPNGGILRIVSALDKIHFPDLGMQPAVRLDFSDQGQGMTQEVLSHIFEPMFTTKGHGSGFGLFISYKIIEGHNGQITVESNAGQGTTFSILLPIHPSSV